ncbi:MAG: hypothetical protein AAF480_06710 [Actinomycetota bacterium]
MFLRASSNAIDTPADEAAITADHAEDANVPAGVELIEFTTAVHRMDETVGAARDALVAVVGRAGMIDAAVTAAVFRGLNIAADTSGIRVDDSWEGTARELMGSIGTGAFRTAANSPAIAG